jgi:FixJ family two-component response regulator
MIAHKLYEYKRWVGVAEGLGGFSEGERVTSSRNLQRIPEAIGNYIDLEREIRELQKQRAEILKVVESLPRTEYDVIYKLFAEDMTMKEVAYHYSRSYDWVKLKKRSAMRKIQAILDERRK